MVISKLNKKLKSEFNSDLDDLVFPDEIFRPIDSDYSLAKVVKYCEEWLPVWNTNPECQKARMRPPVDVPFKI